MSDALRRVRALSAGYIASPTPRGEAARLLAEVMDRAGRFVPPELCDRMRALSQSLAQRSRRWTTRPQTIARSALARCARPAGRGHFRSATTARSALLLLRRLELLGVRGEATMRLLERAGEWEGETAPPFLSDLARLRDELVDRLSSEEPAQEPRPHDDLANLLSEVTGALYERARESRGGEEAALYEYLDDLENDVDAVRAAVRDYTVVLAATCQQSESSQMNRMRGDDTQFENVVVDEAARANPLDLFIPMALAERRIVLVGDHRQLPHILEPEIEAELDQSVSEETRKALRRSLFERLFASLKEREKKDGIRRAVTLDRQYRMHPVLGKLVSDTFYAPHGEGFESGRSADDLAHDLPRYSGRVAAWVDLPLSAGREHGGKSKRRREEARWIAKELPRLLAARPDFSFGVISFYSGQVEEILRELETAGLSERLDDGSYRVAEAWRETRGADGQLKERLRVGTVDAFQGKELDVVILSMTRSNDLRCRDHREARRKFGHLMLDNRLCVAMSRQQRLLIVVGDGGMVRAPEADTAVHGLVAFYKLCEGDHGVVVST
ncbi:MAG: AAA domain-containing protein [Polyangiaceae bacterium]